MSCASNCGLSCSDDKRADPSLSGVCRVDKLFYQSNVQKCEGCCNGQSNLFLGWIVFLLAFLGLLKPPDLGCLSCGNKKAKHNSSSCFNDVVRNQCDPVSNCSKCSALNIIGPDHMHGKCPYIFVGSCEFCNFSEFWKVFVSPNLKKLNNPHTMNVILVVLLIMSIFYKK